MTEVELQEIIDRAVSRALEQHTPQLVEKAADRVEQRFFANVGRHVVTKVLKWVGAAAVALVIYMYGTGVLKP
jgi:phage baseplate assembly protein W